MYTFRFYFDVCVQSDIPREKFSRQKKSFYDEQNDSIMININIIVFFSSLKI